jgi:putative membrane protein
MQEQIRSLGAAVVWSLMVAAPGLARAAEVGPNPSDRAFVAEAAQGGLMEVAAGKLAAQRGLDPAVKTFGQKMVTDHTAANDKLKALADSKQIPLPDSMSADESAALARLESLVGTDFDKTYAKMMVKDHVDDIGEFEKEVKKGQDADVKSFAENTLPTLRHHLMLANQLSSQERKSPSAPTKSP